MRYAAAGAEIDEGLVKTLLPAVEEPTAESLDLAAALADVEREMLLCALAEADGDKKAAAARLGIGERTLFTKLKKRGI